MQTTNKLEAIERHFTRPFNNFEREFINYIKDYYIVPNIYIDSIASDTLSRVVDYIKNCDLSSRDVVDSYEDHKNGGDAFIWDVMYSLLCSLKQYANFPNDMITPRFCYLAAKIQVDNNNRNPFNDRKSNLSFQFDRLRVAHLKATQKGNLF